MTDKNLLLAVVAETVFWVIVVVGAAVGAVALAS